MRIEFDISQPLIPQLETAYSSHGKDFWDLPSARKNKQVSFPGGLEFYHFPEVQYDQYTEMISYAPIAPPWYLIHINLGGDAQQKEEDKKSIPFHQLLTSSILLYTPGCEIKTHFEKGYKGELATFRFPKSWLTSYLREADNYMNKLRMAELTPSLELLLRKGISQMNNKVRCHATLLRVFEKIVSYWTELPGDEEIQPALSSQLEGLFEAAKLLRDPLLDPKPSLAHLCAISHLSKSQFKRNFKKLFGMSSSKYALLIKMEYAKDQIEQGDTLLKSLSYELGYNHPSNFTAAFKKHFGYLPSDLFKNEPLEL